MSPQAHISWVSLLSLCFVQSFVKSRNRKRAVLPRKVCDDNKGGHGPMGQLGTGSLSSQTGKVYYLAKVPPPIASSRGLVGWNLCP